MFVKNTINKTKLAEEFNAEYMKCYKPCVENAKSIVLNADKKKG